MIVKVTNSVFNDVAINLIDVKWQNSSAFIFIILYATVKKLGILLQMGSNGACSNLFIEL